MTVGAAGGLNVIFKVLFNPGEEIITFAPYFSEYDAYAMNVGAVLQAIPPNTETFTRFNQTRTSYYLKYQSSSYQFSKQSHRCCL